MINKKSSLEYQGLRKRTKQLYRTQLLNYILPKHGRYIDTSKLQNVLDLGGNGAMSSIANKISPKTKYTGVDHQHKIINVRI